MTPERDPERMDPALMTLVARILAQALFDAFGEQRGHWVINHPFMIPCLKIAFDEGLTPAEFVDVWRWIFAFEEHDRKPGAN